MPYQLAIHPHLIHLRWQGILVQEEVHALLHELPRLARQLGYLPEALHTFDDVHALQMSVPMSWGRPLRPRLPFLRPACRTALVVNRPELRGVEHLFQSPIAGLTLEVRRFCSRQEALDWLLVARIESPFAAAGV